MSNLNTNYFSFKSYSPSEMEKYWQAFSNLHASQKILTAIATIAGLCLGLVGAPVLFKVFTNKFTKINLENDPTAQKTDQLSIKKLGVPKGKQTINEIDNYVNGLERGTLEGGRENQKLMKEYLTGQLINQGTLLPTSEDDSLFDSIAQSLSYALLKQVSKEEVKEQYQEYRKSSKAENKGSTKDILNVISEIYGVEIHCFEMTLESEPKITKVLGNTNCPFHVRTDEEGDPVIPTFVDPAKEEETHKAKKYTNAYKEESGRYALAHYDAIQQRYYLLVANYPTRNGDLKSRAYFDQNEEKLYYILDKENIRIYLDTEDEKFSEEKGGEYYLIGNDKKVFFDNESYKYYFYNDKKEKEFLQEQKLETFTPVIKNIEEKTIKNSVVRTVYLTRRKIDSKNWGDFLDQELCGALVPERISLDIRTSQSTTSKKFTTTKRVVKNSKNTENPATITICSYLNHKNEPHFLGFRPNF